MSTTEELSYTHPIEHLRAAVAFAAAAHEIHDQFHEHTLDGSDADRVAAELQAWAGMLFEYTRGCVLDCNWGEYRDAIEHLMEVMVRR